MAKDPAFLFYPNDFIGGTMGMTFEEKGAYMELLMTQFNRGHMDSHMVTRIVGDLWGRISDKFVQDDAGRWYNKRLDEEQTKRKSFTASRLQNLIHKKSSLHMDSHMDSHMDAHMENRDRDEDINRHKFIEPTIIEIKDYIKEKGYKSVDAEAFHGFYESKGWLVGKNKMKNWKAAVSGWNARKQGEEKNPYADVK
jgi:uncharacterized protein YdaU (DUF1376 family)